MARISSFKELRVWQEAIELAEEVYALCKTFPKEELFGLTSQLKRSIVSVASNIAEGSERNNTGELIQFMYIAKSSLAEAETQLILARRFGFAPANAKLDDRINKLGRGLMKLIQSLRSK